MACCPAHRVEGPVTVRGGPVCAFTAIVTEDGQVLLVPVTVYTVAPWGVKLALTPVPPPCDHTYEEAPLAVKLTVVPAHTVP